MKDSTGGIQHGGDHYKAFPIQPIDYAEENKLTATEFSIVKYVSRHRFKNGLEDLKKAFHFMQMLAVRFYNVHVTVDYSQSPGRSATPETEQDEDCIEYDATPEGRFNYGIDGATVDELRDIVAAAIVVCRNHKTPQLESDIQYLKKYLEQLWPGEPIPEVNRLGKSQGVA